MNELTQLSANQFRRAADLKEQIDRLQGEFNALLGAHMNTGDGATPRKKHRMSRAGRAAIAAAARARWAKIKGATASAAPASKTKRKMSAAGRARLSAMAKARWKKARAAGKHTL